MKVLTFDTHTNKINSTIFKKACGFAKYTVTTPSCRSLLETSLYD